MTIEIRPRAVARLAWLAAALNLAASAAMLIWLRPGLPVPGSLAGERIAYINTHAAAWSSGWLLWHAAALSLLALFAGMALLWGRRAPLRCAVAALCAAAGLAADLTAEAIYIGIAPGAEPGLFALVETLAALMTGYLGNGLYSLAGILLTWAAAPDLPRHLLLLGAAVWLAGLALSLSTILASAAGQTGSTAIVMPLFVLWASLAGRWLWRREA